MLHVERIERLGRRRPIRLNHHIQCRIGCRSREAMSPSRRIRIDRRRLIASSVVGGAAILTTGHPLLAGTRPGQPAQLLAQDGSANVPMFRGNPARTGEMPGPGPDDSNGIEMMWRFATGDVIASSPAVVDGVVYVGSWDANLYAVNADDGSERWRFVTDGRHTEQLTSGEVNAKIGVTAPTGRRAMEHPPQPGFHGRRGICPPGH